MRFLLLALMMISAGQAFCDTSTLFKLATLRFSKEETVLIKDGIIDISALSQNELFHVQGDALFIPGEFLELRYWNDTEFQQLRARPGAILNPLSLKHTAYPMEQTQETFGSFIIKLQSQKSRELSLHIPRYYHPLDLYVVTAQDVQRIVKYGELEKAPEKNWNRSTPLIPPARFEVPAGDFYLIAHASSPRVDGKNTLNFSTFFLGETPHVNRVTFLTRYLAKMISGSFFSLFVFYLFMYSFRPRDKSSLFLSLYALASFVLSYMYVADMDLTPSQVLTLFTVVNLLGVMWLQCYLLEKVSFVTSRRNQRILFYAALIIGLGGSILRLLEVPVLTKVFFALSFISSSSLILATLYLGIRHQLPGISFFFVGAFLNLGFQYSMMMRFILGTSSESGYYILLANLCMAISLALVNAKEFALTYRRSVRQSRDLEEFNRNLEKMVEAKTNEVRSLLDHIPQGVLSLGAAGKIAKDFSAHLSQILELDDIAHHSFKELILERSQLNSDSRDLIWQTILSILGEDELSFELNSGNLPSEIIYQVNGKAKHLKTTWNTEARQGIVTHILVTFLDVTVEKELEKAAEKQRDELELILELINVQPDKAAQFFSTAMPLLLENQSLISGSNHSLSVGTVRMLFVNAHTVKGAARTLQFKRLAAVIHDAEDYYASILKQKAEIDEDRLSGDIQRVIQTLQTYLDVNQNKLNRSGDFTKIVIDRNFVEQHYHILKGIVSLQNISVSEIVKALEAQNEYFTRLIFDSLPALVEDYKERAIKIAKDLNKARPSFALEVDDIELSPARRTVLDNCMIHLLRNAMDHGIESPEERTLQGKSAGGLITIKAKAEGGFLKLTIQDDGRGLAIGKLRKKGLQMKTLRDDSTIAEVADTIFASGVSTAEVLSDISGRGVGMSAVRSFVEKVGGWIHVHVGQAKGKDMNYYDFHIEVSLPLDQAAPVLPHLRLQAS